MGTSLARPPKLLTAGRIAAELGVPIHRVTYVLDTRPIAPTALAGVLRLFDRRTLARVRHELRLIDAKRSRPRRAKGDGPDEIYDDSTDQTGRPPIP